MRSYDSEQANVGRPSARIRGPEQNDLRHANASLMLAAHVPMEMLSPLLGHSNPTTTRNIYAHVTKSLQEEARRAQAGILASL